MWLRVERAGEDVVLILGGGDSPHIGGVVLKVPGEEARTLVHGTHRDLEVLAPLAEGASEVLGTTVVAVGGIHIDRATTEEIRSVVENCQRLVLMMDNSDEES
ncbi:MAG: hypothetical protein L0Z54_04940 [Thermoplasmata archaeon]|nr:hypothetical protein [Thermoplasmata archaeon]